MENDYSRPLLSSTSRQYYTRKPPSRPPEHYQLPTPPLHRIMKLLSPSAPKRDILRVKTEQDDQEFSQEVQQSNNLKALRYKADQMVRKGQKGWKELLESFEKYKKSFSKQTLQSNEIEFLTKLLQVLSSYTCQQPQRRVPMMKQSSTLRLQHAKILKQNLLLKEALETMDRLSTKSQPKSTIINRMSAVDFKSNESDLNKDQCISLRFQLQKGKQQKKKALDKLTQLRGSIECLNEIIHGLRFQLENEKNTQSMFKTTICMQNEEIISLRRELAQLRKLHYELNRKYQGIIKRGVAASKKNIGDFSADTSGVFKQQLQAFVRIRSVFMIKGYYNYNEDSLKKGEAYKTYLGRRQSLRNQEGVKKIQQQVLRYYKPTFFVFAQQFLEEIGMNKDNGEAYCLAFNVDFLVTLRAILDSRHNLYLMNQRGMDSCSLSAFTVGWLSSYAIDSKTKKIANYSSDINVQTFANFYLKLMNPQMNGNWQIIAFREMLLETLSVDESLFYLKVRYKVFKGDGVYGRGGYDSIRYIGFVDALMIMQQIVTDFTYRKKLEQYIKRQTLVKKKRKLIDAHYFIRMLLQYYLYKKAQLLEEISNSLSKKERNCNICFENFVRLLDSNFPQLSLTDKALIYQKAYSLGRGLISLDFIFSVMNEEGYFRYLAERIYSGKTQEPSTVEIDRLKNMFERAADRELGVQVTKLGVEQNRKLLRHLKDNRFGVVESSIQRLAFMHEASLMALRKLILSKKISGRNLGILLEEQMECCQILGRQSYERENLIDVMDEHNKRAGALRIFNFYRRKCYINKIVLDKMGEEEGAERKIDDVRKQFSVLIHNLKNKYSPENIVQEEEDCEK